MSRKRLLSIVGIVGALLLAVLIIAATRPAPAIDTNGQGLSDYGQRHPELLHSAASDTSDWYLRHPGFSNQAQQSSVDANAPAAQVPVSSAAGTRRTDQPDLSDWYLRHRVPLLGTTANSSR